MKLLTSLIAVITLLLTFPFTVLADTTPSPIVIGGAFALTGIGAPFGTMEKKGVELAIEEVNRNGGVSGRPLELKIEDTQSTSIGTVNATTKLIAVDKVQLIVGPTWLDSFAAAIPVAEKHRVMLISPSVEAAIIGRDKIHPLVFSTYFSVDAEVSFLLKNASAKGHRSVSLVFDQDPFFEWMHEAFKERAASFGLRIVEDVTAPLGATDLRAIVTRVVKGKPDAIIFGFADSGAMINFLKLRKSLAPTIPLFGSHDLDGYINDPNYRGLIQNTWYAVPKTADLEWRRRFKVRYGEDPILTASHAYDAVMIAAVGLIEANGDFTKVPAIIRKNPLSTVSFGTTQFNELQGLAMRDFELKTGQN